jgi:hypothetical protein
MACKKWIWFTIYIHFSDTVQKEGEEVAKKHLKDRKEAEIGGLNVKKYVKKG